MKPKLSVIISAYNEESCISRAIESILGQSYRNFELIIINDGSTDNTEMIIQNYMRIDSRIVLKSKQNTGIADSLNAGIQLSKGEYIARLDADDVSHQNRLEKQVDFLDNNTDIGLVGSWCYIIDLNNQVKKELKLPISDKQIKKYMQKDNPLVASSVMFRRSVLELVGYFNQVKYMEDFDMWIRIGKKYKIENIPLFLVTRYEDRNIYTRPIYHGLSKENIYSLRLRYQLKAIKNFGVYPQALWYLTRTIVSIFLAKLGIKK